MFLLRSARGKQPHLANKIVVVKGIALGRLTRSEKALLPCKQPQRVSLRSAACKFINCQAVAAVFEVCRGEPLLCLGLLYLRCCLIPKLLLLPAFKE